MEASEPFKNSLRSEVPKLGHMEEPETPTVSATSVKPIPNDVDAPSKKHTAPAPTQPEQNGKKIKTSKGDTPESDGEHGLEIYDEEEEKLAEEERKSRAVDTKASLKEENKPAPNFPPATTPASAPSAPDPSTAVGVEALLGLADVAVLAASTDAAKPKGPTTRRASKRAHEEREAERRGSEEPTTRRRGEAGVGKVSASASPGTKATAKRAKPEDEGAVAAVHALPGVLPSLLKPGAGMPAGLFSAAANTVFPAQMIFPPTAAGTSAAFATALPNPMSLSPTSNPIRLINQRSFKRCAAHVAIAYHIFYQQRTAVLQQLYLSNPMAASKLLSPSSFDPTYEARVLRERSEFVKKRQLGMQSMLQMGFVPAAPAPAAMAKLSPGTNYALGRTDSALTPQMQAQFAQQIQSQLALLQQQGITPHALPPPYALPPLQMPANAAAAPFVSGQLPLNYLLQTPGMVPGAVPPALAFGWAGLPGGLGLPNPPPPSSKPAILTKPSSPVTGVSTPPRGPPLPEIKEPLSPKPANAPILPPITSLPAPDLKKKPVTIDLSEPDPAAASLPSASAATLIAAAPVDSVPTAAAPTAAPAVSPETLAAAAPPAAAVPTAPPSPPSPVSDSVVPSDGTQAKDLPPAAPAGPADAAASVSSEGCAPAASGPSF